MRWLTPLGGERCEIRDLIADAVDSVVDPDQHALLESVADYWWNSALDQPSAIRADQRIVELAGTAALSSLSGTGTG